MNDLISQLMEDARNSDFESLKGKYMIPAAAPIIESHRSELFNFMREMAHEGRMDAVNTLYEIRRYALEHVL